MQHNGWDHALKVTADGAGLVGHAGDLAGVLAFGFSDVPLPPRRQRLDEHDAEHVVWHEPASLDRAGFEAACSPTRG